MKRFLAILAIISLAVMGQVYAAGNEAYIARDILSESLIQSDNSAVIAIISTDTVYTHSFDLSHAEYAGFEYKATSASSTPSLKLELEQSTSAPSSEYIADTNWSEPKNYSDIETDLTGETVVHQSYTFAPFKYGRVKITGSATNPADTVISIKLSKEVNG